MQTDDHLLLQLQLQETTEARQSVSRRQFCCLISLSWTKCNCCRNHLHKMYVKVWENVRTSEMICNQGILSAFWLKQAQVSHLLQPPGGQQLFYCCTVTSHDCWGSAQVSVYWSIIADEIPGDHPCNSCRQCAPVEDTGHLGQIVDTYRHDDTSADWTIKFTVQIRIN